MVSSARKDMVVAIVVFAAFAGMLIWSEYIPDPRGREFPVLVSGAALVLCLLDIVAHTQTAVGRSIAVALSGGMDRSETASTRSLRSEALAVAWIAGATVLMILAGFLVAIPAYVFGYMFLYARRSVRDAAITALVTTLLIWVGFEVLLSYELYRGAFAPS